MEATRSMNGSAVLVMMVLILGMGIAAFALFANLITPTPSIQSVASVEQSVIHTPTIALTPTHINNINDTNYLALINRQHAILSEPNTELLVPVWPTVPVSFIDEMYLHSTALQAVADMINTAVNTNAGSFFVSSGFRGQDLQASLYNNGANSAFALPPGYSEHHSGLAVDILVVGVSQAEMANSAGGRWLADNSYRYGLILRYPQGATHITGIEFEPWHFRYVGKPHAYYMMQNNLVLEEYIELIQNTGSLSFEMNGKTYHILYQTQNDGMIYLPSDLEFTVSSNNTGSFIVTTWE